MNYVISLFCIFILLSCKSETKERIVLKGISYDKLVEAEDLIEITSEKSVVILDFRPADLYNSGHIAGAINIWRTDLENKEYPYTGMRPEKHDLEVLLGKKGIDNNSHIVVYDDKGSVDAARFWWLLKYYYYDSVSILNGGLEAWKAAGGAISKEGIPLKSTNFILPDSTRAGILASKDELNSLVQKEKIPATILDVRSSEEYRGSVMKKGAYRSGRLPGSQHVEWVHAIDLNNHKKFKEKEELERIYGKITPNRSDTIVVYCHSGSRSAHTAFVMDELLNFENIKNYEGSWTEWSYFDHLPIETDSLETLKN